MLYRSLPRYIGWLALITITVTMVGWPLATQAVTAITAQQNTNWSAAVNIPKLSSPVVLFGHLSQASQVNFFRFTAPPSGQWSAQLAVPVSSSTRFQPQVVLFQPEGTTVGPVMPFAQPPKTAALVYPAPDNLTWSEPATQTTSAVRWNQSLTLDQAGTYYLAVYNAGDQPGRWRLTLTNPTTAISWSDVLRQPQLWWYSQLWAGWTIQSFFLPVSLMTLLLFIWWLIFVSSLGRRRTRR